MKANKNVFLTVLTLAALSAGAWAQTSASTTPATKKKHKAASATPAQPAATAADVQALKEALAAQQQQIQQLTVQLQQNQQNWQQTQSAATEAATQASAARAENSQEQQAVGQLKGDVADLKNNATNTALTLQETQKNVNAALESPLALHFKGVTLTPGGYLDATFTRRSRALGEDAATPFNSITMPGAAQNTVSEFYGSGRQSRITLLTQGQLKDVKLSGYVEADFNSGGVTSNSNSTNSYTLRQRQVFGQATFNSGWSFTGGQMWSLVTETGKGMDNRSEAIPLTIDTSYNVGFSYARQYGLRVVKNIDNKVWFGFAMENAQATVTTHSNAGNFLVGEPGANRAFPNTATYSFNPSPDLIAKVAFEPGFGHYEVFGLFSRFRDRTYPCEDVTASTLCGGSATAGPNALGATNVSRNGGGVGANARWTFANKHVVFGLHGLGGSGIGRYASAGLPDASIYANGSLHLIREFQGLGTLEWHGSKLDIYGNVGAEYGSRTASFDPVLNKQVGYGAPTFANNGCFIETGPGSGGFAPGALASCTADTRVVQEATLGFWYRFYNGPKGRFQYGTQFSYATRYAWSGSGTPNTPHGVEPMVMSSFRYFLP
jgi:hypothetical protein